MNEHNQLLRTFNIHNNVSLRIVRTKIQIVSPHNPGVLVYKLHKYTFTCIYIQIYISPEALSYFTWLRFLVLVWLVLLQCECSGEFGLSNALGLHAGSLPVSRQLGPQAVPECLYEIRFMPLVKNRRPALLVINGACINSHRIQDIAKSYYAFLQLCVWINLHQGCTMLEKTDSAIFCISAIIYCDMNKKNPSCDLNRSVWKVINDWGGFVGTCICMKYNTCKDANGNKCLFFFFSFLEIQV